ncbi:MAG: fused MFS/spermidine synthase [Burkholderiales bacterium]|nr:fused MFS/spermidine synthase [Burkholderiales bacterium]
MDVAVGKGAASAETGAARARLLFAATLFGSALLLFAVQPMFAKMVLPVLGGTPAVWSVAMVVFQALLLAGYAYAHVLARYVPLGIAVGLHSALALVAMLALPIAIAAGWGTPPADGEAVWLVGLFVASVGLPFFALSANGPLLQAWYAARGGQGAQNPYLLYAASNLGSFAALILYPLVFEPVLPLDAQSRWWSVGFVGVAAAIGVCGLAAVRAGGFAMPAAGRGEAVAAGPGAWGERIRWVGLSMVPSGLLVAVTAHIQTDIAAIPLLWVVPLALFLLTFVLAFRDRPIVPDVVLFWTQAWGTAIALGSLKFGAFPLWMMLPLTLGLFLVNAMVCHGALYRCRPPAGRLTEFYLCLSIGGVIGGLFAGLAAPHIFSTVVEYPVLLVAALACRPGALQGPWREAWKDISPVVAVTLAVAVSSMVTALVIGDAYASELVLLGCAVIGMVLSSRSARRCVVLGVALCFLVILGGRIGTDPGESRRSFFGVHRIAESKDGRFRVLFHGTTIHGAMRIREEDGRPSSGRPEPTTYYATGGAIADSMEIARALQGGAIRRTAVVGLGTGSLACQRRPGEAMTFYEIDPEVIRIARDPSLFRFLPECGSDAGVVHGDARLTLAASPESYGLILVDAFSSDAIPTHLLTREALALYGKRLTEDGVLAFHISNRHFDLTRPLAQLAEEMGARAFARKDGRDEPFEQRMKAPATVLLMLRGEEATRVAQANGFVPVVPDKTRRPWTDNYVNLIAVMLDMNRP